MKLTDVIEMDKKREAEQNQQIIKRSKEIKIKDLENKLTSAFYNKQKYSTLMKQDEATPVQKAKCEACIFKIDEYIKGLKKDLSAQWNTKQ